MRTILYHRGRVRTLELLVLDDESVPARELLEPAGAPSVVKLDALLGHYADLPLGSLMSREKFKKVEGTDGLFEFKSFQDRLFCALSSDQRVVLLCGVRKKQDKLRPSDVKRAVRLMERWRESERSGGIRRL